MSISIKNNQDTNLVVEVECLRLNCKKYLNIQQIKGVIIRSRAVGDMGMVKETANQYFMKIRKACFMYERKHSQTIVTLLY